MGLEDRVYNNDPIELRVLEQQNDGSYLCLRKTAVGADRKVGEGVRPEAETRQRAWHAGAAHSRLVGKVGTGTEGPDEEAQGDLPWHSVRKQSPKLRPGARGVGGRTWGERGGQMVF